MQVARRHSTLLTDSVQQLARRCRSPACARQVVEGRWLICSRRAFTGLQHDDIRHIAELVQRTGGTACHQELGRKSLDEIRSLGKLGLTCDAVRSEKTSRFAPARIDRLSSYCLPHLCGASMSIKALRVRRIADSSCYGAQKDPAVRGRARRASIELASLEI